MLTLDSFVKDKEKLFFLLKFNFKKNSCFLLGLLNLLNLIDIYITTIIVNLKTLKTLREM